MRLVLMFTLSLAVLTKSVYHYDYEEHSQKSFTHRYNDEEEGIELDAVVPTAKEILDVMISSSTTVITIPTIATISACDNFNDYALNCTINAAVIYNSSKKCPPKPTKLYDWCSSIRTLTNCALDWNTDCKERTENYFNEESIKGHIHVLEHICDDSWFLSRYSTLEWCIENSSDAWEQCYTAFKAIVDEYKNSTKDWTHYEPHFYLCCARTQFRRCTLDALFNAPRNCSHEQAVVLQKFSTVVSEGDVFQDCEINVMYTNCPNGDPRPTKAMLTKLIGGSASEVKKAAANSNQKITLWLIFVMFFVLYYR